MVCHGHTEEDSDPGRNFLERIGNRLRAGGEWDLDRFTDKMQARENFRQRE